MASAISVLVMGQKAIAASTPDTITPMYSALMILAPARARTKNVPITDAMIDAPPSISGYSTELVPAWSPSTPPSNMLAISVTA